MEQWPVYCAKDLIVGNLASSVGICTLWAERSRVAQHLDLESYAVCGNLYSLWGLNYIVRNILANPKLRYLIVCGPDRSGSGEALVNLVRQGVDHERQVIGSQARIDPLIPHEALELVRRSVEIIDLRGMVSPAKITEAIQGLLPLPPFAEPQIFPEAEPGEITLPSERTGFKFQNETVAGAWLELLRLVMVFGQRKPSEYTSDQKELLNILTVITKEDPQNPYLVPWFPFSHEDLERYYPRVLSPEPASERGPGRLGRLSDVSYTYGERLRNYRGMNYDQIETMIQRLRKASHTRRAIAVTWDPLVDGDSENPPCLLQLLTNVQNGQLYLTAVFRSHDIYGAWPENAFALRRLQQEIADALGLPLGPLTILSQSAHLYADSWSAVEALLNRYYPKRLAWRDDPRGNFHILLEDGRIVVEHGTTVEGRTGLRFEGKTARELYLAVIHRLLVSLPEHAAYLGSELQKAEFALRLGLPYEQDRPLNIAPHRGREGGGRSSLR